MFGCHPSGAAMTPARRPTEGGATTISPSVLMRVLSAAVFLAALAFLGFLIENVRSQPPRDWTGFAFVVLATLTLAFLTGRTLFLRVDVDRDGITVRRLFSTTRVRRADVAGYRHQAAAATRATDMVIETRAGDRVVVPDAVRRRVERETWLAETPNLHAEARKQEKKARERDSRWGKDAETRRAKAGRWETRCVILNVVAGVLCFAAWLPDDMSGRGYWTLLMGIAALPPIGVMVCWFTYGGVDLLCRSGQGQLTVGVLMLSPLMLAWRALDWTVLDAWQVWLIALVSAIPISNVLDRMTRIDERESGARWLAFFGLSTLWIGGGLVLTNVRYDRTPPATFEATVTSSEDRSAYRGRRGHLLGKSFARVHLGPWALDKDGTTLRSMYGTPRGERCTVNVHRGTLRFRWIDLGSCVDPNAVPGQPITKDLFKRVSVL